MYHLIRPFLFQLDPEQAHGLTLNLIRLAGALPPVWALLRAWYAGPEKPVDAFGLTFHNPVGLAAGYDKGGLGWRGLAALGFGHIEIGTVTLRPQPGNPKPRIFRLPQDQAVINRMGFPGKGAEFVRRQLNGPRPAGLILGINLGKNKDTPLEEAAGDYLALMKIFASLGDYLAINVSSPNTVGLRRLQARQELESLLSQINQQRRAQEAQLARRVPVLVKLAPDLSADELEDALDVLQRNEMDGVIATNTTIARAGLSGPYAGETGGLSGAPLRQRSTQMIRQICRSTQGRLPVVGVGGVMNAGDAREKLEAGATLVQVYTGLVYAGSGLVKQILTGL